MNHQNSINLLDKIGIEIYSESIYQDLRQYWHKALASENPLWQFVDSQSFIVSDSAHLIAIQDSRNKKIGFIGFYESLEDVDTRSIIQEATSWLRQKGVEKIVSPFDGSILQKYRFNNDADQIFPGEPTNPNTYVNNFVECGFTPLNHYVSGIRTDFNTILPYVEKDLGDFSVREFDITRAEEDTKILYDLAIKAFENTSGYFVHFSWDEFSYWYSSSIQHADPRYIEILYHHQKPIGMCYSFVENKHLVMKTIAILPEYQGQGASKYLAFSQHTKAKEDKLAAVVYALIRTGNAVSKMPYPGVNIYRKYQTLAL